MAVVYNVAPRYSAGSPALVDRRTAMAVAADECLFYGHAKNGHWGEEWKARAEREGLAGIVEERLVCAHGHIAYDIITHERTDRR